MKDYTSVKFPATLSWPFATVNDVTEPFTPPPSGSNCCFQRCTVLRLASGRTAASGVRKCTASENRSVGEDDSTDHSVQANVVD